MNYVSVELITLKAPNVNKTLNVRHGLIYNYYKCVWNLYWYRIFSTLYGVKFGSVNLCQWKLYTEMND
jgi:hypothetical protein